MENRGILQQTTTRKRKAAAPAARKEIFTLDAPRARTVLLLGDFTQWEASPVEMKKEKGGSWKATVTLEPGAYEYRFKVDGAWFDDPHCPRRRTNAFGGENCVREVS